MSLIASFHLIPAALVDPLLEAAQAQQAAFEHRRWGLFRTWKPTDPDPFWEFLRNRGTELEEMDYSGIALVYLEMLAPGLLDSSHPLGQRLSGKDASFVSFAPDSAGRALDLLAGADLSRAAIEAVLVEDEREDVPEFIETVEDCARVLAKWLEQVTDGQVGLLHNG